MSWKASTGDGTKFAARALKDDQKSPVTKCTYMIHPYLLLHLNLFPPVKKNLDTPDCHRRDDKVAESAKKLIRSFFHSHNYLNEQWEM